MTGSVGSVSSHIHGYGHRSSLMLILGWLDPAYFVKICIHTCLFYHHFFCLMTFFLSSSKIDICCSILCNALCWYTCLNMWVMV